MSLPQFDRASLGGPEGFAALTQAVREAGDEARRMFEQGRAEVQRKADASPVTAADREVEDRLRSFVQARYPDASFYGEETGQSTGHSPLRFVVDPIDGTRAFMRGLPTWSVLVGVEEANELVAAIAYMPAAGELYRAQRDRGAWLIRGDRAAADRTAVAGGQECLRVSSVPDLDEALVCHGGLGQFADDDLLPLLPLLASRSYTQRGLGDFAGYAALLKGQADAVIDPAIQPYDVAPASLLVQEAGGRFTDLDGTPTIYGRGGLASNGKLHEALLALVREAR